MTNIYIIAVLLLVFTTNCGEMTLLSGEAQEQASGIARTRVAEEVTEPALDTFPRPAACNTEAYLPDLRDKRVAVLVNHTSRIGNVHLVDTLLRRGVRIVQIFAPEHGFRGTADAGAKIKDGRDVSTGLPIKSLYGKTRKPTPEDLAEVDVLLFDVQDVGARFYTYISSLFYLLEAAGEEGKDVMVLDRPNPNGHYVDGPMLRSDHRSFVGIAPLPVVHGLTVGEFARMAVGEGWLAGGVRPALRVVKAPGYTHARRYVVPVPPSPNLPNERSIYAYPSLCFFEGTAVSVGRGTDRQFQLYGHPQLPDTGFSFTPQPGPGSRYPKLEGQLCHGEDFSALPPTQLRNRGQLDLRPLLTAYRHLSARNVPFFTRPDFFDLLAGGPALRAAVLAGATEAEIRASWQPELAAYRELRARYLLYPE